METGKSKLFSVNGVSPIGGFRAA